MGAERLGLTDESLDATRASILAAYFTLRVEHDASDIGTREIAQLLKRQWPERPVPSDSVIQRTIAAGALPHRGRGQPSRTSRAASDTGTDDAADGSPLLPVRRQPPRIRAPK